MGQHRSDAGPELEELDAGWGGGEEDPQDLDAGWGDDEPEEPEERPVEAAGLTAEERTAREEARKERVRLKAAAKKEHRRARATAAQGKQKTKIRKSGAGNKSIPPGPEAQGDRGAEEIAEIHAAEQPTPAPMARKRREGSNAIRLAWGGAALVVLMVLATLLWRK